MWLILLAGEVTVSYLVLLVAVATSARVATWCEARIWVFVAPFAAALLEFIALDVSRP